LLAHPFRATAGKRPLIILLHGHAGSAAQIFGKECSAAPLSVWLQIADRDGLLLAARDRMSGKDGKQGWNDCRIDADNNPETDDVELVRAIIDKEVAEDNADPTRTYAFGMSNGGMMAFRLASELGDKLAGFTALSAAMASKNRCAAPKVPVSALFVSGTAGPLVPYNGGDVYFFSIKSRGGIIGVE
jgi:polyhydroxybutyrate depolymerase